MKRLLVTGFEPFGAHAHNPSAAVLERLPERIDGLAVDRCVLPVETEGVKPVLARLHAEPYSAVLHLGLAEDRRLVTIERRAVNWLGFTIADNRGVLVPGRPILEDGAPAEYPARLPVEAILSAWAEGGFLAGPSDSAGTFLCNQVMYTSLHTLPERVRTGFIHLPPDETIGGDSHQPIEVQARAIQVALAVIAKSV